MKRKCLLFVALLTGFATQQAQRTVTGRLFCVVRQVYHLQNVAHISIDPQAAQASHEVDQCADLHPLYTGVVESIDRRRAHPGRLSELLLSHVVPLEQAREPDFDMTRH